MRDEPQAAATMARQLRRLRFSDTRWETRFRDERHAGGLTRARVVLVAAIFVVTGLGVINVMTLGPRQPEFLELTLRVRFLAVAPIWLLALISTGLPGHAARADTMHASSMVGVCWALAFLKWHHPLYFPQAPLAAPAIFDVAMVLVISAVTLPMRFRHLAVGTGLATLGPGLVFLLTQPSNNPTDGPSIAVTLAAMGLLVLLTMRHRELTERRMFAQREELKSLNTELARLNAEKNEFMAIASHDLRAPLAAVRGLAEQLHGGQFTDPEKRAKAHAAIRDLTGQMLGLVNDYLGAHAAESGMLPVKKERVNLQDVAAQAGARHAPVAARKAQRVEVAAGRTAWVQADAGLVGQVADNFISNALKFSPHGATVRVGVAVAEDGSVARFEVSDEGPGIAVEDQARLFRKFVRAGAKPTGGETSHGLGLAVAKRLAETMGGSVGCESPARGDGTGARFWVELPATE